MVIRRQRGGSDNKMRNVVCFIKEYKKMIFGIIAAICLLGIFGVCYGTWNDMWYDFGKNLYYFFH